MSDPATLDCPSHAQFRQALAGALAEDALDRLITHLGVCSRCQAIYESQIRGAVNPFAQPEPTTAAHDPEMAEVLGRTKAANDWMLQQQSRDGRFQIIRKIGQGGMGEIFECFDQKLNRLVALKKLRPDRLTPNLLGRLQKEASLQAALNSPHIVQIYEVGTLSGVPYLALEYISGGTLRHRLQDQPLAPLAAARLVRKIAAAVHQAHLAGVLHRDLKPANILLTQPAGDSSEGVEPEPKIADFGLAKLMGEASELSESTLIAGTPAYLSPEQAANRTGEIGPASDIYSLGVILYECLTGHPPFNANQSGLLLEMIKGLDPVSPRKLVPGIGRNLETICMKCLAKEPARRYPTAQALADDLGRFAEGRPILARPAGKLETAWRWSLRNRRLAVSLATIFVLVSWFSLYAFWAANRQNRLRLLAEAQTARANQSEAKAIDQRDRAYQYYLLEFRKFTNVSIWLDNPKIKFANPVDIEKIQDEINDSIEVETSLIIKDREFAEEKPELVVEMLFYKALLSKIAGNLAEADQNNRLLMRFFEKVNQPSPSIVVLWLNSANILANSCIGRNDMDGAFSAWNKVRAWYISGRQRVVLDQPKVANQFRLNMKSFHETLIKENRLAEAAELERELAGSGVSLFP